jgi:cation diffusion facilitator family transporter
MSSGTSVKVILFAFGANLGIALAKWVGFVLTASASMAAEAIHSTADCANQVLLLIGSKLSLKKPSKTHPFGYGRESFFWSFLVAVLLFSMGGVYSIFEGIHKLSHPTPIENPWLGIGILAVSILLEAVSYWACLKEIKVTNRFGSLRRWVKHTTSSDVLVIFLEDTAALTGLVAALTCLLLALLTQNPIYDAIGSITVGSILVVLATVLARETKSLLIGEAPAEDYRASLEKVVSELMPGGEVLTLIAQQIGASQTLLAYKIKPATLFEGKPLSAAQLIQSINEVERKMRSLHPEIRWQFAETDDHN